MPRPKIALDRLDPDLAGLLSNFLQGSRAFLFRLQGGYELGEVAGDA